MKRLTVYLNYVRPEGGKIKNTLSYLVRNEKQIRECLSLHEDSNIKKWQVSFVK